MRIAIIGTGIAGNVAAYYLNRDHDITVFEANDYIGGHTNTVDVAMATGSLPVDTGFIVFNNRTYPNFVRLLDELGVESQESEMSFSVRNDEDGLEYNGSTLDGLFAQRRNLLRPSFIRMIREILRFNREAPLFLDSGDTSKTLGDLLAEGGYSKAFVNRYLVPMGAAIWSAELGMMQQMPAHFFVRFFANHGLLSLDDRPVWRTIRGGSREYVSKLVAGHRHRIELGCPVESVSRLPDRVVVKAKGRPTQTFDAVFIACHSDEALKLLSDPSPAESEILGAIRYQQNDAVLHTDSALMPVRERAWASWNYHMTGSDNDRVTLTYHMNRLQRLEADQQYFVTLNSSGRIDPRRIIREIGYAHPVFTSDAVQAQDRKAEIDGVNRTWYCGAYWRYGFHEDGVVSALSALKSFEAERIDAEQHFRRAG
jgi:predicted NAD/FAD-binding protein